MRNNLILFFSQKVLFACTICPDIWVTSFTDHVIYEQHLWVFQYFQKMCFISHFQQLFKTWNSLFYFSPIQTELLDFIFSTDPYNYYIFLTGPLAFDDYLGYWSTNPRYLTYLAQILMQEVIQGMILNFCKLRVKFRKHQAFKWVSHVNSSLISQFKANKLTFAGRIWPPRGLDPHVVEAPCSKKALIKSWQKRSTHWDSFWPISAIPSFDLFLLSRTISFQGLLATSHLLLHMQLLF